MSSKKSKKRSPLGRKLEDEEIGEMFYTFKEHVETDMRDSHNAHMKVCSFNQATEGLQALTVYLTGVESVSLDDVYESVKAFDKRAKVETEEGHDGKFRWMVQLPLHVPYGDTREYAPKRRHRSKGPRIEELALWTVIFVGCTLGGQFLGQPTVYSLLTGVF